MKTVAVIGLGTMGLGLAEVYAAAGFNVLATDADPQSRNSAHQRLAVNLKARIALGKISSEECDAILSNITVVQNVDAIKSAHLVIEAIIENLSAKQNLIMEIERVVESNTVIATNTSSLSINSIANQAKYPERVLGLHFFNPAPVMKLVEIVPHANTSTDAVNFAHEITKSTGKIIVRSPDRPGFIVNRCARPFYGEALAMLEEGRHPNEIDAAIVAAGYRIGPFQLIDLIGADINFAATQGIYDAMNKHPRYHPFPSLKRKVDIGELGRKSGKGFVFPNSLGHPPKDVELIVLRIEATLVNEAAWLLHEGGVSSSDIDIAMKLGMNFPRGPFEMLKLHGSQKIRDQLSFLEESTKLAGRYIPSPTLGD
mgnify:FL=1